MDGHGGHRRRLKNMFLKNGLSGFDDVNALELLLFYAVPRRDTNGLAHRLIDRFGSLEAVVGATREELLAVDGVGEHVADVIMLVPLTMHKYLHPDEENNDAVSLITVERAGTYAASLFRNEHVNDTGCLIRVDLQCNAAGTTAIPLRQTTDDEVVRITVDAAARGGTMLVMLVQNNGDDPPVPNIDDLELIRKVIFALASVNVQLADFILVSGEKYFSLAEKDLLKIV